MTYTDLLACVNVQSILIYPLLTSRRHIYQLSTDFFLILPACHSLIVLKNEIKEAEMQSLRSQMNPHFMYNALNSIQQFITSHEISSATIYLAKFAKLMRQSLDYSELQVISIEKEVDFLEDYLYINKKLRFQDKLEYQIIIDKEIEDDIIGIPTMIVQPYVENAIEHGLRLKNNGKVTVEDGHVKIKE